MNSNSHIRKTPIVLVIMTESESTAEVFRDAYSGTVRRYYVKNGSTEHSVGIV